MIYLINKYGVSLMSLLKKTIGFIAILGVVPAAFALTARPSIVGTASTRIPTMRAYTTTASTTTTTASLLADAECIEAYTDCLEDSGVCGSGLVDCTNKTLFFSKRPLCTSTLMQCSASGINSLFGTSNQTLFSNKDSDGEYIYPTDGSVLGQLIEAAAINNRLDTSSCVRTYTNCLKKDDVCGQDFELCTTNKEFKVQKIFCESTLARCQNDGLLELFGTSNTSANPTSSSRVGIMISEGAALAAVNAVSTCYSIVDNCFLNACKKNPFKCKEGASKDIVDSVDMMLSENNQMLVMNNNNFSYQNQNTRSDVSAFLRNSCLDIIGTNKYCYATFLGKGAMPTDSQLRDENNQDMVYSEAYSSRMNNSLRAKIDEMIEEFDTDAKSNCAKTIKSCALNACGGGIDVVCYSMVSSDANQTINNDDTYNQIKTGCLSVVNTDANCKYAASSLTNDGLYSYTYLDETAFDTLFPEYKASDPNNDPIGVIAQLNAYLSTNFNDAALAKKKEDCQATIRSCVQTNCGKDYENCYRNRTDVYSSLTNAGSGSTNTGSSSANVISVNSSSGNVAFNNSMNKVGGVLDYTIILGLCLNTVKTASTCSDHLAIETQKASSNMANNKDDVWGDSSTVRDAWLGSGDATQVSTIANSVRVKDDNGNYLCKNDAGVQGICYNMSPDGDVFDEPVTIDFYTYAQEQGAKTLFESLLYDLEKEAQAKYNAKLTYQQNMCMAANSGGIMGSSDLGSSFMWVKLKNNKIPSDYSVSGLKTTDFVASNDIYGSFCRVRITLQSADKDIQEKLKEYSTAYFATGDTFTCGSWIPKEELENIATSVAASSVADKAESQKNTRTWLTILGTIGSGVGGGFLTDKLQDGDLLGGLLGTNKQTNSQNIKTQYANLLGAYTGESDAAIAYVYGQKMLDLAEQADVDNKTIKAAEEALEKTVLDNTKKISENENDIEKATNRKTEADNEKKKLLEDNKNWKNPNAETAPAECSGLEDSKKCDDLDEEIKELEDKIETLTAQQTQLNEEVNEASMTKYKDEANKQFNSLKFLVDSAVDNGDVENKTSRKRAITNLVGAGISAAAGGIIINRLTKNIQDSSLSAEEKQAYEEWMSNVGDKIHCYLGGEDLGTYGEYISISIE